VDLNSSPLPSRYLIYDDGTFALQYASALEYRGTYRGANAVVTFEWEGWSAAVQLSDFEDGVYIRPS
jgi:hypothetical protein